MDEGIGKIETGEGHTIGWDWCTSLIYIRYYPNNSETTEAVEKMNQKCGGEIYLSPFKNETRLLRSLKADYDIAILFPDGLKPLKGRSNTSKVKNAVLSYTIRIHASKLPTTKQLFPEKLGDNDSILLKLNRRMKNLF